jgi:hypothetical protein
MQQIADTSPLMCAYFVDAPYMRDLNILNVTKLGKSLIIFGQGWPTRGLEKNFCDPIFILFYFHNIKTAVPRYDN